MTYNIETLFILLMRMERVRRIIERTETVSNLLAYDADVSDILEQMYEHSDEIKWELTHYFDQEHILN